MSNHSDNPILNREQIDQLMNAFSGEDNAVSGKPVDGPSDEEIFKAASGELEPEQLNTILDHSLTCGRTAHALRLANVLLREFENEDAHSNVVALDSAHKSTETVIVRAGISAWWSAAAGVVMLIGAAWLLQPWSIAPDVIEPPSELSHQLRGTGAIEPLWLAPKNATLDAADGRIAWSFELPSEQSLMRISALDASGNSVFTSEWSQATAVQIPQATLCAHLDSTIYYFLEVKQEPAPSQR